MKKAEKVFTVRKGRHGFNGNALAEMTLKEAQSTFKQIDARVVKEAHAEAVKTKKENDKAAKKK